MQLPHSFVTLAGLLLHSRNRFGLFGGCPRVAEHSLRSLSPNTNTPTLGTICGTAVVPLASRWGVALPKSTLAAHGRATSGSDGRSPSRTFGGRAILVVGAGAFGSPWTHGVMAFARSTTTNYLALSGDVVHSTTPGTQLDRGFRPVVKSMIGSALI